jgi:hypothetical protein
MFSNKEVSTSQPFGIPLNQLEDALRASQVDCHHEDNGLVIRQDGMDTRVLVDRPHHADTPNGPIKAVITVITQLPEEFQPIFDREHAFATFNPMATLGCLFKDGRQSAVGSRLTVYEGENAWNVQFPLIMMASLTAAPSLFGAIGKTLSGQRSESAQDCAWSEADFEQVQSCLRRISVCTGGGRGLTAEFGLKPDAVSAAVGHQVTALWQLHADQPHPDAGAGLFCLLQLPHAIDNEGRLEQILANLNRMEMGPTDTPPHFGAWCKGNLGNNPAYISFLPNALHAVPGIAVNMSAWAAGRAQWAAAMLASYGVH